MPNSRSVQLFHEEIVSAALQIRDTTRMHGLLWRRMRVTEASPVISGVSLLALVVQREEFGEWCSGSWWNLPLLDELKVPCGNPSRLTFLPGVLECLLGSLRDTRYLLVSILRPLFFLVYKYGFRYDFDDPLLTTPPCFSETELDLGLSFCLLLSLLYLSLNALDASLSSQHRNFVWLDFIHGSSSATAGNGPRYDVFCPPPKRKVKLLFLWHSRGSSRP